jgi:hypothetical protein
MRELRAASMAVNKGVTHKISQEISTVNPSIPDSKFSQGTVTLTQARKNSICGINRQKITEIRSEQDINRHVQKADRYSFSMNFTVLQSNQIVRIFTADPAIN